MSERTLIITTRVDETGNPAYIEGIEASYPRIPDMIDAESFLLVTGGVRTVDGPEIEIRDYLDGESVARIVPNAEGLKLLIEILQKELQRMNRGVLLTS